MYETPQKPTGFPLGTIQEIILYYRGMFYIVLNDQGQLFIIGWTSRRTYFGYG